MFYELAARDSVATRGFSDISRYERQRRENEERDLVLDGNTHLLTVVLGCSETTVCCKILKRDPISGTMILAEAQNTATFGQPAQ